MKTLLYYLLCLLAEALALVAFALCFLWGAIVAAGRRGYAHGYAGGAEAAPQPIYDED